MPASSSASTGSASGAQSLSIADSNSSPSRAAMTAMPCRPMSPDSRTTSPGRTLDGAIDPRVLDHADAGGVDEEAVALAAVDHLGVAGDDRARPPRRAAARIDATTRQQRLHRQAFLEDEAGAQEQRPRAAHRQVVDRAVDRQRADVAAGEEQRPHDVGVGGEREPRAAAGRGARRRAARRAPDCRTPAGTAARSAGCVSRPPPPCASCTCVCVADRHRTGEAVRAINAP